jgi:hypothetical protein
MIEWVAHELRPAAHPMTGNPTAGGRFARKNFTRNTHEQAPTGFRGAVDTSEVEGRPGRNAELYELERLIRKYPTEPRKILWTIGRQRE